tara:strand:- start:739 stop:975 length:237 start_codon:yes stop_codon:yes gene_type:complete
MPSKGEFLNKSSKDYLKRVADEYLEISGRKVNTDKMTKKQLLKFLHANRKDANLYNKGGLTKKNYVNPVKIVDNLKGR